MSSTIITLTTDFGAGDGYVGAMKGVVLGINSDAALVDISHDIPPQDVAHGAFVLGITSRHFGPSTVHVGVVDPGVGTSRRALLLVTPRGRYVAPDNGLLTYVLADQLDDSPSGVGVGAGKTEFMGPVTAAIPKGCSAYELNRSEYWRHPVSDTFHGRDIFAPAAAHLSLGVPPDEMGEAVDEVVSLNIPPPSNRGGVVEGRIIYVDRFGNLVSNVRSSQLPSGDLEVEVCGARIQGIARSYAEAGGLTALVGSHGYLEIAETNGRAADRLAAGVGSVLRLYTGGVVGHSR